MPISKSPFRTARKSQQRPSTDGSVLSAACRSSARPASWCRIRARHGSPRSIRASMWRAPQELTHIAGATGASSEAAVRKLYGLSDIALIDMGDFVGGMLKYIRRHPVPRVTIAGGVAKMTKLAQGLTDLHSKRGEVDRALLAQFARAAGGSEELCCADRRRQHGRACLYAGTARRHCARRCGRARRTANGDGTCDWTRHRHRNCCV